MKKPRQTYGKLVTLTIGDWANDGHGRTHRVNIRTNLSKPAIETAYKKGTQLLGFDFQEEVARGYEDNELPAEYYQRLVLAGLPVEDIFGPDSVEDENRYLDYDTYWLIWVFIVKLGDPSFRWKQVMQGSDIKIRGYGLFFS